MLSVISKQIFIIACVLSASLAVSADPFNSHAKPTENSSVADDVIKLYSADWCFSCKKARKYFEQQGLAFEEYDIIHSQEGRAAYATFNSRIIPVIAIGEQKLHGFTKERFLAFNQSCGSK